MNIYQVWANHIDAFGKKDIDNIMKNYNDNSIIYIWDHRHETYCTRVYNGYNEIRDMFLNIFLILKNLDTLKVNLVEIVEERNIIFFEWMCKGCGINKVNDIFIFDDDSSTFSHQSISMY